MRKKKQRNKGVARFLIATAIALSLPGLINIARQNLDALSMTGTRAAMLSAAIGMPDGSLALLRERFNEELYHDDGAEQEAAPQAPQPEPRPIPEDAVLDEPDPSGGEAATPVNPPKIPTQYAAALLSEDFSGRANGTLIPFGAGFIKNDTKESEADVEQILEKQFDLELTDTDEPQVLILHTHCTESFERYDNDVYDTRNTWRSRDNNLNMAAVGSALQQVLEDNGVGVLHDTTQHDYPSYNGSYERSAKTVQQYLDEYPSIKIVLDLHRDAMERENAAIIKPVTEIDGRKAAQVMIIAGCDDGTMNMPNWPENLRFAAALQDKAEQSFPGLMRPIYLCYRKYNMDLSDGSLLLEFGSNANTLDEAVYSAQLAGQALADLIKENWE